ncbi:hypothetical protein K491DRAFT_686144 [Lophiostoma macrostomum CBS 122681]|uniref:C2H2-type domain-containing protein n=1 Tax=Lophiostoma macrostomum CBS 122681 TaxID=1314788 RepID=A0A6A6TT41_9PLEO|nr:hypothetical protein K491DRAFT_686144 [Lophiostoma macrostomum CBS 122681]
MSYVGYGGQVGGSSHAPPSTAPQNVGSTHDPSQTMYQGSSDNPVFREQITSDFAYGLMHGSEGNQWRPSINPYIQSTSQNLEPDAFSYGTSPQSSPEQDGDHGTRPGATPHFEAQANPGLDYQHWQASVAATPLRFCVADHDCDNRNPSLPESLRSKRLVTCSYCGKVLRGDHANGNLRRHQYSDACPCPARRARKQCPLCPAKTFSRADGLSAHVKKHHPGLRLKMKLPLGNL